MLIVLKESKTQKARVEALKREANPVLDFMADNVQYEEGYTVSTADLLNAFLRWCENNAIDPPARRTIVTEITRIATRAGAKKTEHARTATGARGRGFQGMGLARGGLRVIK